MVPIFLARTVEGLAAFEDTLFKRDGFFQRQEHFEAKIEAVRLELDRNSRAKTVFANPDAVQLLIASLTAESLLDGLGMDGDGAVRRQQFVFASAVLLTTDVAMRTIRANPPLLRQLWQYVESPTLLDPVQLQYWCRCAGGLLLSGGDGATPSGSEPPVAGLGTLLRHLLRHLHSDAVAVLLKCLLSVLAVPGCASCLTPLAGLGRPCDPAPWIRPPAPRPPPSALPPTRPDPTAPLPNSTPPCTSQPSTTATHRILPSTGVAARCRCAPCWRRCCRSPPNCCSTHPSVPTMRPTCCARCATRSRTTRTRPRCSRPSSRASRRCCAARSASACRYVALPS